MKKHIKSIMTVGLLSLTLVNTGCMKDVMPTDIAIDEQVAASSSAAEAMVMAMPAYANDVWSTTSHCYFGYPAEMIIRDMLTGDMYHTGETGYSHFISWGRNLAMGSNYAKQQFHWNYYFGFVKSANNVIAVIDPEGATPAIQGLLGTAYAYRAMLYLDLARMYEFLPNDVYTGTNEEGTNVLNLTVPIVTDETTDVDARENPRATREEMKAFIESDLNNAEELIVGLESTSGNTLPDLACVYGLKARLYMWVEDYANAQKYARLAIDNATVRPLSQAAALSTTSGYNTASDFMWAGQQTSETYAVATGIINWTSWVSNQTTFGYTGTSTALYTVMDRNMYERISDTDWRKLEFKAPAGSALDGQNVFIDATEGEMMPDYTAIKFRPNAGNEEDYSVGAATAYPIMRVEEMYFIEAEAAAHQNASQGQSLINNFMKNYRDPAYNTTLSGDALVEEIVFQKRVELWGEGQTFFDIKRLNYSVTRGYPGTNCTDIQCLLNTNGRPAWMNYVIVRTEENNNSALINYNNPDPTDKYTQWTE